MERNKTRKYLKYAIGEVVLVVVGILIALQINNWNEKRKVENTIESLLVVFETELEININQSNELIKRGYEIDAIASRYIQNSLTREDILNDPNMLFTFRTRTRDYIDDNLDALINLEKELPKIYVALVPELKELKARIESQRKWEKAVVELSIARRKELADELPAFYLKDSISMESNINYFLSNPFIKNKIMHYNDYDLSENTWDASLIRTSAVALLWKIKALRGEKNMPIDEFLSSLDLKSFQEYSCNELPLNTHQKINMPQNFIFYNNTNDTIYFKLIDSKGEKLIQRHLKRPPKSFQLSKFRLGVNDYIEVLKNDTCNKIYGRIKEDYLIIN